VRSYEVQVWSSASVGLRVGRKEITPLISRGIRKVPVGSMIAWADPRIELPRHILDCPSVGAKLIRAEQSVGHLVPEIESLVDIEENHFACSRVVPSRCHRGNRNVLDGLV
jgi:hypothetical protein